MIPPLVHPAMRQLLRFQTLAKLRRMLRGFSTPRRSLLSCLGLLLGVLWLGNAALGILMRQPLDPAGFRDFVPLALLAYGLWHVLKVTGYRPKEPIELTPAERELLGAAPFRRRDLVTYRLAAIFTSALLKAICFSVLMLCDLKIWVAGLVGALLALLLLDLVRMAVEIVAWGVSTRTYQRMRATVVLLTGAAGASALVITLHSPSFWRGRSSSLGGLTQLLQSAMQLRETWIGVLLESPFHALSNVITAETYSAALAGWVALSAAMVVGMAWLVVRLDAHFLLATTRAERQGYQRLRQDVAQARPARESGLELPRVPWRGGAGPLAWRQAIGAHRHATGLALALAAPGVLACLPWLIQQNDRAALVEVVGVLAFYSFLLLPAALKFDFRRDYDRLTLLKSFPLRPAAVAIGQITTPVVLASGFQLVVLLVSLLVRPLHPGLLVVSLLLLVPLNVFIFALDNLVYLLYPYRLSQEGLEIFIRATLTFTAKGLLFVLALLTAVGWAFLADKIARVGADWSLLLGRVDVVFVSGSCLMIVVSAAVATYLLAWAYRRLDPHQDAPA